MFYSPIFGICFQLPIICAEERIHITKSKEPDSTGDLPNVAVKPLALAMGI